MPRPYFLNVDLDIESKTSLAPLLREFGDRVSVMFSGRIGTRYCLFLEIAGASRTGLEKTINGLCALIEGITPRSRKVWDQAHRKQFDIGYEARLASQRANHFRVRTRTLRRIVNLGASLAVTFYRQDR
jgi:hypothetical protein